jgi:carbamoyl-phosphate synthase large subunit
MSWLAENRALMGGAILLAAAVSFWLVRRRHRAARTFLRQAVGDPDPETRAAALALLGQTGLARHLDLLVGLVERESSPFVLDALAGAVVRNQWEPVADARLLELRLWAQRHVNGHGPHRGGASTAEEPTLPGSGNGGHRHSVVRDSRTTGGPGLRPDMGVLVTGAGGPAGVAVIQALRAQGRRVVAADADELAVGLRLADGGGVVPRHDEPGFIERICELAAESRVETLVSTVAEELPALGRAGEMLAEFGLATWLPEPEAVRTCIDKWHLAQTMRSAGIPCPATGLASVEGIPRPWVVKPRYGRGSRDVYMVGDEEELVWAMNRVAEPIVQTRLVGLEFTVDCLVDRDGVPSGAVPRWRLETKAGISTKGRTFRDARLVEVVAELLDAIGLRGPANVQGFVLAADGSFSFVDVNPRFSGGLPLSIGAGADLVGEYLRGVSGLPLRPERLTYRPGVTMTRHLSEVFEP